MQPSHSQSTGDTPCLKQAKGELLGEPQNCKNMGGMGQAMMGNFIYTLSSKAPGHSRLLLGAARMTLCQGLAEQMPWLAGCA